MRFEVYAKIGAADSKYELTLLSDNEGEAFLGSKNLKLTKILIIIKKAYVFACPHINYGII